MPEAPAIPTTQPAAPEPSPAPAAEKPASPAEAAEPAVESAKDKLEAAGGDVPEQKKGESDKDYELRLSRLTRELRQARAEIERTKIDRQQFETMKAELEKAKNKRIKKSEFVDLIKRVNAGEAGLLDDDEIAALPPEVRERVERLEAEAKERRDADNQRQLAERRQREVEIVGGTLKQMEADVPLFAGRDVSNYVLDTWWDMYRASDFKTKPDLEALIGEMHAGLANTVVTALQSESTRRFLLGKHPELKALLGAQEAKSSGPTSEQQGAGRGDGSAAKSDPPQEPPSNKSVKDRLTLEEEARERSRAAYRDWQKAQRGG